MIFGIRHFWKALGHLATPQVTAMAQSGDGQPLGITVFSFNPVLLDPPVILVSADQACKSAMRHTDVDDCAIASEIPPRESIGLLLLPALRRWTVRSMAM